MTTSYDVYDLDTGAYLRTLSPRIGCPDISRGEMAFDSSLGGGYAHYYCKSTLVIAPMPLRPSLSHIFNYADKQWEDTRTLQDNKDAKWASIKRSRSQAEYAGFTWDSSTFDSDALSQNRITGAVTLAMLSPAFVIDWILMDNTTRLLDQAGMAQVGAALGAHVATQFSKGVTLRAQIEAATTKEEVEAIAW